MKKNKIKLGVNIDHAATLRQVRGGTTAYPDLVSLVKQSARAGADQITIHLREDRRHIQLRDLAALSKSCPISLNLEMAVTPEMTKLARKYKPDWVCLVPEKRQELTTEGGLDIVKNADRIKAVLQRLQPVGIEVSFFIGPDLKQVQKSFELGADAVEFHTGHWVAYKGEKKEKEWNRLVKAAKLCHYLGMRVHAGHGLDYATTAQIKKLPFLQEVNIGHSIICYAVQDGITRLSANLKNIEMKLILEKKNLAFSELGSFCDYLLGIVEEPYLLLLEGDLGAGKTSFVRAWVQALIDKETDSNMPENFVSSPTFTLHQEYKIKEKRIHHFDLYRLRSEEELETTGFWEIFQLPDSVIIEWPERANWDGILTLKRIYRIRFQIADDSSRSIKVYRVN